MVGVSQFKTNEADTITFVEKNQLTFRNIYDQHALIAETYAIHGVPSYVFIDKQGRIAKSSTGAHGVDLIESWLAKLSAE